MKRIKILSLLTLTLVIVSSSCTKTPDVEYTSTYKMSGEWFVQLKVDGEPVAAFHKVMSYNTSDPNSNQIWFDDLNYWPFWGKLNVDYSTLTFKAGDVLENLADEDITARVVEGKILPLAAHSKSGVVVDSFYLKMEFSDDPGTEYEYAGHQRTGFFEDEY